MTDGTVHIAFGFDQNYAMQAGVAMLSICINTPGPVCFHALIAEDVNDTVQRQIEDMIVSHGKEIVYHVVSDVALQDTKVNSYFSKSTYDRLLVPEMLSSDIHKAIYLDCDVITLQSLRPLWELELADHEPVAMAFDGWGSDVQYRNLLGIPLSQTYYNAGVMLINLDCWRKEGLSSFFIQQVCEHDYLNVDQDVLNINIGQRIKPFHFRFNFQHLLLLCPEETWLLDKSRYSEEVYEAKDNPAVIHYVGGLKPWHAGYPMAEDWLKYKNLSPWKDVPLMERHTNEGFQLQVEGVIDNDIEAARSIAAPLMAIAMKLSIKHKRLFVLLRKTVWTIARKRHLLED